MNGFIWKFNTSCAFNCSDKINYTFSSSFITVKIERKPRQRKDMKGVHSLAGWGWGGLGSWFRFLWKVKKGIFFLGLDILLMPYLSTVQSSFVSIFLCHILEHYMISVTIFKGSFQNSLKQKKKKTCVWILINTLSHISPASSV